MNRIIQQKSLKSVSLALLFVIVALPALAQAQDEFVKPSADLEMGGIPPIPKSLAEDVGRYTRIYGLPLAGWAPDKREIWVKSISQFSHLSSVSSPGEKPKSIKHIFGLGIYDFYIQPQGNYLIL